MRKYLVVFATLFTLSLTAQDAVQQVLVFRNTGEVNLFYSDRLDSVVCSPYDKDSLLYEEPVSQVFYSRDTVMVIPLAEIDSVAFGERNEIDFQQGVKELTEADIRWIIRTEGTSIYYRPNTPRSILPTMGQRLFCGINAEYELSAVFPNGLCARVISVQSTAGAICVTLTPVSLDEIFSKFFFAGKVAQTQAASSRRKAPVQEGLSLSTSIPLGELGSIDVSGNIVTHGDVVMSLANHYYHADIDVEYGFDFDVSLKADESSQINYEELLFQRNIATFYRILNLRAAFGAFANVSAEMQLGLNMERTYRRHVIWTRHNEQDTFQLQGADEGQPFENKAKVDLTLDGSVFFGPLLQLDFVLVGDVAGARAKMKVGPQIDGSVNLQMIRQMHEYNPQLYGNAQLRASSRFSLEGYVLNRRFFLGGDVEEHRIFEVSNVFAPHTLRLFPEYMATRGTQMPTREAAEVSAATKSSQPIAHELESGFEILDEETREILDSIYVGSIAANAKEPVGLSTEFSVPASDERRLTVRPVFHYAGCTVGAAPAQVQNGVQIQPVIFAATNGVATYVASYPFTGEVTADGTNYRAGAYLPIPVRDTVFHKEPRTIDIVEPIRETQYITLVGTWTGKDGEKDITLVFEADGTGSLCGVPFTYETNSPQSGQILLTFTDETKETLVLDVLHLSETALQYRMKSNSTIYSLTRK